MDGSRFNPALSLIALGVLLYLACDYGMNWVHQECIDVQIPVALTNGKALQSDDLSLIFQYQHDWHRFRYLSYAATIINIKFRIWLSQYLPPHPTLSLTWISSLLLGPLLMFRLLCNLAPCRQAAWIGMSLFCLSTGFLGSITMRFHPAKPLVLLGSLGCLTLASEAQARLSRHGPAARWYAAFLVVLFLALFCDESAGFIFIAVPLFFPDIFRIKSRFGRWAWAGYALVIVGFFLTLLVLIPAIQNKLPEHESRLGPWNSLTEFIAGSAGAAGGNIFASANIALNARNLWCSQFLPWDWSRGIDYYAPIAGMPSGWNLALLIASLGYGVVLFRALPVARKGLVGRSSLVLLLYFGYHAWLTSYYQKVIDTSYYYGNLFSIFAVMPLALLLDADIRALQNINRLLLVALLALFVNNFLIINSLWRDGWPEGHPSLLSYRMVREVWRNRNNRSSLQALRKAYPPNAQWLFLELSYLTPGSVDDPGKKPAIREVRFSFQTADPAGNGELVVIDPDRGLQWAAAGELAGGNDQRYFAWEEAIRWADDLVFAGYSDWRLPLMREASSLINNCDSSCATVYFPGLATDYFWTSTPFNGRWAWFWSFDHCDPISVAHPCRVCAVRSFASHSPASDYDCP